MARTIPITIHDITKRLFCKYLFSKTLRISHGFSGIPTNLNSAAAESAYHYAESISGILCKITIFLLFPDFSPKMIDDSLFFGYNNNSVKAICYLHSFCCLLSFVLHICFISHFFIRAIGSYFFAYRRREWLLLPPSFYVGFRTTMQKNGAAFATPFSLC